MRAVADAHSRWVVSADLRADIALALEADQLDRIAKQAMGTPWVPRNPRPIPTPAEVKEILELAA